MLLEAGASARALEDWRLEHEVSRVSLRAWLAFAESRVRAIEVSSGESLRSRGAGDLEVLHQQCSARGLLVSLPELA
eukprot:15433089-Alexandrium_andersonii.AAC.1